MSLYEWELVRRGGVEGFSMESPLLSVVGGMAALRGGGGTGPQGDGEGWR